MSFRLTHFVFALGLFLRGTAGATPVYQVIDLGALTGGQSGAMAVNAAGVTVGWSTYGDGGVRGVSNSGSGIEDLGILKGGFGSTASAINNSGQVVGTTLVGLGAEATMWSSGKAVSLGTLGGYLSYATGINDIGMVTGLAADAQGVGRAFVYQDGSMASLGAAGRWSSGYGINESGAIVGTMETTPGRFEAFVWTPGVGLRPLGTLGGWSSYGYAINANGIVVGNAQVSNGRVHAFYSNGLGTLLDLGTLGKGNSDSFAYGVNGFGNVVGYSDTGQDSRAFLWSGAEMQDLNTLVAPGGGWWLDAAYGINDRGQIVGTGTYRGETRGFRLDPILADPGAATPEPASFWLLLTAGLAGVVSMVRRKR